jgi:GNAT superfamily N-acetyltransferase
MTAGTESADAMRTLHLDLSDSDPREPEVLAADSWMELRDVRLTALKESPHAFVSDSDSEAAFKETDWRKRIESATWVAVRRGGAIVGVACAVTAPEEPLARYVESVWVDVLYRREGILRAMLEKLRSDAWLRGATQLRLWVLDTNGSARDVYEKLSFRVDTEQEPVDTKKRREDDTFVKEQRMYRDISSSFL